MYTLYSVPDWASLCVHLALEEMGQPFERRVLDWDAGELRSPEFLARSPFGLVPALQTPDGPMFETGAILLWLSERHGLAPAPMSPGRAGFLKWFFFVNQSVHTTALYLLHPYRPAGEGASRQAADIAHARMTDHLAAIEAMIALENPVWLSTAQPSILTCYLGMLVRWCVAFPAFPEHAINLDATPLLKAVLAAAEARPAAIKVAAAEGLGPTIFTNPAA
jgi:glutathione S-transferase